MERVTPGQRPRPNYGHPQAYPESTVTLRPRQGGTYYIAVTNRIPFESGTFDLSVIDLGSATLTCTYID